MKHFSEVRRALDGVAVGACSGLQLSDAQNELDRHRQETRGLDNAIREARKVMGIHRRDGKTDAQVLRALMKQLAELESA
jgi:hypothetical protein